jgi:hypothetical protein
MAGIGRLRERRRLRHAAERALAGFPLETYAAQRAQRPRVDAPTDTFDRLVITPEMFSLRARPWYRTRRAMIAFIGIAAAVVISGVLLALRAPTTAVDKPTTIATTAPNRATPASPKAAPSSTPPGPPNAPPPSQLSAQPIAPEPAIAGRGTVDEPPAAEPVEPEAGVADEEPPAAPPPAEPPPAEPVDPEP